MENGMKNRLESAKSRLEEIDELLSHDDAAKDLVAFRNLTKERANLEPQVEKYNQYLSLSDDRVMAEEMSKDSDAELSEMGKEEIKRIDDNLERLIIELNELLLPKDPLDDKNIIVEIRGGAGGDEAALFAAEIYRMYVHYAEGRNWKVETLEADETGIGGMKSVNFMVTGSGAYSVLKYESGVHRVQRVPETEASGRIQTSAATVAVMPEAEEVEFTIDPKDLQIDTYRSSGAGGQHVNKTESAIRITHLPTGTVVECQDERSQYKNKDRAMKILRSRLYEAEREKQNAAIAAQRRTQVGTGDRSGKIRTYNFPQNRVTDHRIGWTVNQLDRIIEGKMDDLIQALLDADQKAKIAGEDSDAKL